MDPLKITRWKSPGGKVHAGSIDSLTKHQTWGWTKCGQEFGIGQGQWIATQWKGMRNNANVTCLRCRKELNLDAEWIVNHLGDKSLHDFWPDDNLSWEDLEWEISVCHKDYTIGLENPTHAGRKKVILFNCEDYIIDGKEDFDWMLYVAKCTAEGLNRRRYMR
jgi:hypothetical protein